MLKLRNFHKKVPQRIKYCALSAFSVHMVTEKGNANAMSYHTFNTRVTYLKSQNSFDIFHSPNHFSINPDFELWDQVLQ